MVSCPVAAWGYGGKVGSGKRERDPVMSGWIEYISAFVVFFLTHSLPVRPAVKTALVGRIGGRGFTIAYSLLSIVVLTWLIVAARRAPFVPLWDWAPWQNHVTLSLMLVVCILATLAIGRPNLLSFGGRDNNQFNPEQPGLIGWVRHPLLTALMLWALAHILPNGNLAHVLLFGIFAGFAAFGMAMIDRRRKRQLGADRWSRLARTRRGFHPTVNGVLRVLIACAVYMLLIGLHGPVIGVAPLP